MKYRIEKDSLGEVKVPADKLWGAQTQRSLENFKIGKEKMPLEVIYALAYIKKAAAGANAKLGVLSNEKASDISDACDRILNGELNDQFPLSVWQTGSGTQSNMNVNEVIAHLSGLHPNDDINKSQSSNDTFPSAMHIAAVKMTIERLLPSLGALRETLDSLSVRYKDKIKVGRTHLQDATPVTFGQEIGAWAKMLSVCERLISDDTKELYPLALGGTAVGTGLNAPAGFDKLAVDYLKTYTGLKFEVSPSKLYSLSSKDILVRFHSALKMLATDLFKIASDIKLLSCGPRCGIGELVIPANEPGSSIMPGKVNPTQCEAMCMLCLRVMGNDVTVSTANSQGQLQLNTYMPLIIATILSDIELLADGMDSFRNNCASGIAINEDRANGFLDDCLMLITCLTPKIGYDRAAEIAKAAYENGTTLREEAIKAGVSKEEYDKIVIPANMV